MTSPPATKPLPNEPPVTQQIPYRPPPSLDDFLTAPPAPARAPPASSGAALQAVPSILRPAHVRQQQATGSGAPPAPVRPGAKTPFSKAAQEAEDARFAAELARTEGIDVDRLRAEEADAELARRLAAEDDPAIPGAFN